MDSLLNDDDAARLGTALRQARFDSDSLTERFGAETMNAAARGDFRSLLAATEDPDPQGTLTRLFRCGVTVSLSEATAALDPLPIEAARRAGLLVADDDGVRAGLALAHVSDGWLLSDPPRVAGHGLPSDYVLGPGDAAATMAGYMRDEPVESALDLGCGCGVLGLRLARHATRVTATDLSARALRFTAANAAINGLDWELSEGDMLEPLAGRTFDHIVSNPPFIVGPGNTDFEYRDSGRPADGICAELARRGPALLNPGGSLQFLANWVHVRGEDWRERVAGWFDGTGCDVWAIQRDVLDPLDYVRMWERDSAREDPRRSAEWLDWFESAGIEAVGFGMITAERNGSDDPVIVCEDVRDPRVTIRGERVSEWFGVQRRLRELDDVALLNARLRLAPGVELRQDAGLGESGWEVERQLLVDTARERRMEEIDPLLVAFLGGCDGSVEIRTQVGILAQAHEADEALLAASLMPVLRHFIRNGFLTLVD